MINNLRQLMQFKVISLVTLVLIYGVKAQEHAFEPSFAYDFSFIIPAFSERIPLNSTTLHRALINKDIHALQHFKEQLLSMNPTDKNAILSNINFHDLRHSLMPEFYATKKIFNEHPFFKFYLLITEVSILGLLIHEIPHKTFTLPDVNTITTNIATLLALPATRFLSLGLCYLSYWHYIYHQAPIIKTCKYLHELELLFHQS